MKKLLLIFVCIIFFLSSKAQAETIKVSALDAFSTATPANEFRIQTLEPLKVKEELIISAGTIITGQVVKIEAPKRGKRDGYFEFIPTLVVYEGKIFDIDLSNTVAQIVGYEPIEPAKIIKSVAKTSIGWLYKGASQGLSFVEGVAQAQEGERLKSGFSKVYKDSPLSYIEVGNELNITEGDIIILKLKKIR